MGLHRMKRGLDLPLEGSPEPIIEEGRAPARVAVVAADYPGMKPTMHVAEGDHVQLGQLLFDDKKTPGVRFTSPGSGTVEGVHRGAKRALQSVVVRLSGDDAGGTADCVKFSSFTGKHPGSLNREEVKALLVESGEWTALRTRPYGKVADPETVPKSIFVTAMDSNPLAPDLDLIAQDRGSDLERGLAAISRLTDGSVFVCRAEGSRVETSSNGQVQVEDFAGPHPAGTASVHIHTLDPVDANKLVWHIGLQDLLAIGALFESGNLDVSRTVSLAGPPVVRPRLLKTRRGASTEDLTSGELTAPPGTLEGDAGVISEAGATEPFRLISGSVLSGRSATGAIHGYLGRFDNQLTVIREDDERVFLGWLGPGFNKFSLTNLFLSKMLPGKRFDLGTSTEGSHRAIVPIGLYERVMPIDVMPTQLLKAIVMTDVEHAQELGCLELIEEDLALCTFVCPGKIDYGPHLRDCLTIIEKDG